MNDMELVTDVPVIEMELDVVTRNYPVIPNPEGTPTDDISSMEIDNVIYAVKDEEARTELEDKVDKVEGKDLSTNDFTNALKSKLDGIEEGAEVNVQSDFAQSDNLADDFIKNKPTKLSDFDNDEGFIDNSVNDLENYYKKSETYTKSEVNSALNGKADKSDTYTKSEVDFALENKVNKDGDKVLSDNNYSDTDKTKLDGIEAEANKTVVDNALDGTSANPVENRVVKSALDEKLNADETAVNSNGLVIATPVTDTAPYIYRQTPVKESFKALMKKIVGASVVWNQILPNGNFADTSLWGKVFATLSVANNIGTIEATDNGKEARIEKNWTGVSGHKYLCTATVKNDGVLNSSVVFYYNGTSSNVTQYYTSANWITVSRVISQTTDSTSNLFRLRIVNSSSVGDTCYAKNCMIIDLTAMFGTTIADYVYTLETSQSGSGIAWLQSYGFFTKDYYAYKQNTLESGCVSAHKTYDGETLLTNTELSPITLRGLFKLSTDKLTVDGDEYNADGSVTRKRKRLTPTELISNYQGYNSTKNNYQMYLYTSDNAIITEPSIKNPSNAISNFDTCESSWVEIQAFDHSNKIGVYHNSSWNYTRVVISIADTSVTTKEQAETWIRNNIEAIEYELATPTAEQTTPFTETEIVGSTEEFIDYEVAQSNRDVAIPVGTETDYYQEMKLPSLPTTSGNHNLIYNVATGFGWS